MHTMCTAPHSPGSLPEQIKKTFATSASHPQHPQPHNVTSRTFCGTRPAPTPPRNACRPLPLAGPPERTLRPPGHRVVDLSIYLPMYHAPPCERTFSLSGAASILASRPCSRSSFRVVLSSVLCTAWCRMRRLALVADACADACGRCGRCLWSMLVQMYIHVHVERAAW